MESFRLWRERFRIIGGNRDGEIDGGNFVGSFKAESLEEAIELAYLRYPKMSREVKLLNCDDNLTRLRDIPYVELYTHVVSVRATLVFKDEQYDGAPRTRAISKMLQSLLVDATDVGVADSVGNYAYNPLRPYKNDCKELVEAMNYITAHTYTSAFTYRSEYSAPYLLDAIKSVHKGILLKELGSTSAEITVKSLNPDPVKDYTWRIHPLPKKPSLSKMESDLIPILPYIKASKHYAHYVTRIRMNFPERCDEFIAMMDDM